MYVATLPQLIIICGFYIYTKRRLTSPIVVATLISWEVHLSTMGSTVYRCHNYYLGIIINLMFNTKHEHNNTFPRSRARLRFRGGT
jgi:hypothetical protein